MSARSSWVPWAALIGVVACDSGAPLVSPPARGEPPSPSMPASATPSMPASATPSMPASATPSVPAPVRTAGVVVDAPGGEPRFRLDAPPAAGATHRVRLTVVTAAAAGPEGGRMAFTGVPGIVLDLDTQSAARPGWVALRLAQARATDTPSAGGAGVAPAPDASLVSLVNGALQPLTGLVALAPRVAASGEGALHPLPWRFAPPPGAPAEAAELLGNVHDAIDPLTLALPAVPIGLGAKFTETLVSAGPPGAPGAALVRTAEVVHIDGEGARLAVTLRFRGATLPSAGDAQRSRRVTPAGELEGEGEGTLEIAVGRPFPVRGALTLETRRTAVLPSDTGGAGRSAPAWRLTTRMTLTLEPR